MLWNEKWWIHYQRLRFFSEKEQWNQFVNNYSDDNDNADVVMLIMINAIVSKLDIVRKIGKIMMGGEVGWLLMIMLNANMQMEKNGGHHHQ